jgi:hypothetical protein
VVLEGWVLVIIPALLVLPTQAAVEAVLGITVVVLLVVTAAPVSLSSKSHLRTMPHSHLV